MDGVDDWVACRSFLVACAGSDARVQRTRLVMLKSGLRLAAGATALAATPANAYYYYRHHHHHHFAFYD